MSVTLYNTVDDYVRAVSEHADSVVVVVTRDTDTHTLYYSKRLGNRYAAIASVERWLRTEIDRDTLSAASPIEDDDLDESP